MTISAYPMTSQGVGAYPFGVAAPGGFFFFNRVESEAVYLTSMMICFTTPRISASPFSKSTTGTI